MQECRVCGLLFLGGGACPSCGSQVAVELSTNDVVLDDESIPGLDDVVEAMGPEDDSGDGEAILPFGMGAKAEVLQSALPFGVGSNSPDVGEVTIQDYDGPIEDEISDEEVNVPGDDYIDSIDENLPQSFSPTEVENFDQPETPSLPEISPESEIVRLVAEETPDAPSTELPKPVPEVIEDPLDALSEDVPDMWRIDAAAVDMDEIYSQDEQIIEVSFDDDLDSGDVQVTFDDFHHTAVEDSMASDDDAPSLHPAKALPVDTVGEPDLELMIQTSFNHMGDSSWIQAAQVLSSASTNRQNDPSILNNLGLALLQSALEMDNKGDPMSSSQYEASIMALRQGAKVDSENNTLLLNLAHALLVSGRAEKALGVLNVLRARDSSNVEVENALGAGLIQLGRFEEARSVLSPYAEDTVVLANLELI